MGHDVAPAHRRPGALDATRACPGRLARISPARTIAALPDVQMFRTLAQVAMLDRPLSGGPVPTPDWF
jgi:hypothetical protein